MLNDDVVWIFEIDDMGTTLFTFFHRVDGIKVFVGEKIIQENGSGTETPESFLERYLWMTRGRIYPHGQFPLTLRVIRNLMFPDETPATFTNKEIEPRLQEEWDSL